MTHADDLITEAMEAIGYPVDGFEGKEAAVSVKYPEVADNYRTAHAIAENQDDGKASTDHLRQAMVLYRSLFERLVGMPAASQTEVRQ